MTACRDFESRLIAIVNGALPPAEAQEVLAHLDGCGACRTERDQLNDLVASLHCPVPGEEAIDWAAFRDATVQRGRNPENVLPFRRPLFGRGTMLSGPFARPVLRRFAGIAAVLAVASVALFTTFRIFEKDPFQPLPVSPGTGARAGNEPQDRAAELLERIDAISASDEVASVLSDGRELLHSLATPLSCGRHGNDPAPASVDLAKERAVSGELLARAQYLDNRISGSEAERASAVWSEMRDLLLDLRVLPDCASEEDLKRLRETIARTDLMTRLDLVVLELDRGRREGASNV